MIKVMPNQDGDERPADPVPTHESVTTRAEGRPPEEASSDDPEHQAQVILEESEERTMERADEAIDEAIDGVV
jgi:hypothetical protein